MELDVSRVFRYVEVLSQCHYICILKETDTHTEVQDCVFICLFVCVCVFLTNSDKFVCVGACVYVRVCVCVLLLFVLLGFCSVLGKLF